MSLIESLSGIIIAKNATNLILGVGGINFQLNITTNTFQNLPNENEKVMILTYLHVKEDALDLFGFSDAEERNIFVHLNSVSGIGPKSALNILSGSKPNILINNILSEDVKSLTVIPGIGPKTAKRIILELKEKFMHNEHDQALIKSEPTGVLYDARRALESLGYATIDIKRAIDEEYSQNKINDKLEDVIRKILSKMVK